MKFPSVIVLVFVSALVAGLVPVLNAFWPTATVWWSAILVVVLGSIAAAVQVWKDMPKVAAPPDTGTPGIAASAPAPVVKQRGFLGRWIIG